MRVARFDGAGTEGGDLEQSDVTRRQFIEISVGAAILTGLASSAGAAESKGEVPRRTLGRTAEKVSMVAIGGFHLGKPELSESESIRIIRAAIDNGINFLDNCWDYNNGQSEIRMGKALQDGYRQRAFLMTKIDGRDQKSAARQIDESLARLKTDHVDLLQFHEIIRMSDPERIFQFDTVQMPLNVMDAHYESFEKKVLPVLVKNQIGVLGMKPMGDHFILDTRAVTAIECLHYPMNLPTSTVITGCDSMPILEQALKAARGFRPLKEGEVQAILAKSARLAQQGKHELYKTTHHFDGTYQNPQWLG